MVKPKNLELEEKLGPFVGSVWLNLNKSGQGHHRKIKIKKTFKSNKTGKWDKQVIYMDRSDLNDLKELVEILLKHMRGKKR